MLKNPQSTQQEKKVFSKKTSCSSKNRNRKKSGSKISNCKVTTTTTKSSIKFEYEVKLFDHLYKTLKEENSFVNNSNIHPVMIQLGEKYSKRVIIGANARCIAFLFALKTVINDFETPPNTEFSRALETTIKNCLDYLNSCRPLAVSVLNAHKYLKISLIKLQSDQSESNLRGYLLESIDGYIKNQIEKAAQSISSKVQEKISNDDVILIYGCSSLINHILEEAFNRHVRFHVICVDSRPFHEGKEMLRRLITKGLSCTTILINAIGFIMPQVTKILFGAHCILANGYVMSRIGTAQIALIAKSYNIPVLVCCETYKFNERVQTDSIVSNELSNPADILKFSKDKNKEFSINWNKFKKLSPLNLNYDITPSELITAVVTEISILPCTSVPVILRIK